MQAIDITTRAEQYPDNERVAVLLAAEVLSSFMDTSVKSTEQSPSVGRKRKLPTSSTAPQTSIGKSRKRKKRESGSSSSDDSLPESDKENTQLPQEAHLAYIQKGSPKVDASILNPGLSALLKDFALHEKPVAGAGKYALQGKRSRSEVIIFPEESRKLENLNVQALGNSGSALRAIPIAPVFLLPPVTSTSSVTLPSIRSFTSGSTFTTSASSAFSQPAATQATHKNETILPSFISSPVLNSTSVTVARQPQKLLFHHQMMAPQRLAAHTQNTLRPQQTNNSKRKRRKTSATESAVLRATFDAGIHHPPLQLRKDLAVAVNMTERQIQVWFQNRRQKLKKGLLPPPLPLLIPSNAKVPIRTL